MIITMTRKTASGSANTPINIVNPVDGLKDNKITIRRKDETGQTVYGYSSELVFSGVDADEIKQWLVNDQTAFTNYYDVILKDECCSREYNFILKSNNIDWCENNCEVTAQLSESNTDTKAYDCLASTLIWDNHNGFQQQPHPRFPYCIELRPRFIHDILLILVYIVRLIFALVGVIVAVISGIITVLCYVLDGLNWLIDAINSIPGVDIDNPFGQCPPSLANNGLYDQWSELMDRVENFAIGCGRLHPAPLIRDYLTNVCDKCSITWSSAIFAQTFYNGDYHNACYFEAPVKNGLDDDSAQYWQDENRPIMSGIAFLDMLKKVFNAEYRIINGMLIFERRDYFNTTNPWLDVSTLPETSIKKQCYTWTNVDRPALGDFRYQKDGVDWVGNEATDRYNDIVEWNSPVSELQKGIKETFLDVSPARFRNDGITPDFLSSYDWIPFLSDAINRYKNALLMNEGKTFLGKILLWDGNSRDLAFVKHHYGINTTRAGADEQYNYPLWFSEETTGNLYDRFHAIENPRSTEFKGFKLNLEILLTCDIVTNINIDRPIQILYNGQITNVKCDEIEVDYSEGLIKIQGEF